MDSLFWKGVIALSDKLPDPVVIADKKGEILVVNPAVENVLGFLKSDVLGQNVKMLMPENIAETHDKILENYVAKTGGKESMRTDIQREMWCKKKDGELLPIEIGVCMFKDPTGEDFFLLADIRDITRLKDVERKKNDLMATVSHELRTPLNGVIGLSESLKSTEQNAGRKKHLVMINNCAVKLLGLVNDIMEMNAARLEQMVLSLDEVDLNSMCREWVDKMANEVDKRGRKIKKDSVEVEFTPGNNIPVLDADKERVGLVLYHIIGNGLKFTPKGKVSVSLVSDPQKGVVITVEDTGIGIAQAAMERIFKAFEQEEDDHEHRQYEGLGLGLSVSAEVVKCHGGKIWLESEQGVGTKFHFNIPTNTAEFVEKQKKLKAQKAEAMNKIVVAEEGGDQQDEEMENAIKEMMTRTVLVVDDDAGFVSAVKPLLEQREFKCHHVSDCTEAMNYLSESPIPDAILLDLMNTTASFGGMQFLETFRKDRPPDVPVYIVSQKTHLEDKVDCVRKLCNGFSSKPLDESKLRLLVEQVASQVRLRFLGAYEQKQKVDFEVMKRIIPKSVVERMMEGGGTMIADKLMSVSVTYCTVHQFEILLKALPVTQMMPLVNKVQNAIDQLAAAHDHHVVKADGCSFIAVTGHEKKAGEEVDEHHAERAIKFAEDLVKLSDSFKVGNSGQSLKFKIGIESGLAFAGMIGGKVQAPKYTFYGDSVAISEMLCQTGVPAKIHVGPGTFEEIRKQHEGSGLFNFQERGELSIPAAFSKTQKIENVITYIYKIKPDEDLAHLKVGKLSLGGAEDTDEMNDRLKELEAQVRALQGGGGDDGGEDLLTEQLQKKGMISAVAALGLVEPLEKIAETILMVMGDEENVENVEHPIVKRLSEIEGEVFNLTHQVEECNKESRKSTRILKELEKSGLGGATGFALTKEGAESLIDSLDSVVQNILLAAGIRDDLGMEQDNIPEHPLVSQMKEIESEIEEIQQSVMDFEDAMVAIKNGEEPTTLSLRLERAGTKASEAMDEVSAEGAARRWSRRLSRGMTELEFEKRRRSIMESDDGGPSSEQVKFLKLLVREKEEEIEEIKMENKRRFDPGAPLPPGLSLVEQQEMMIEQLNAEVARLTREKGPECAENEEGPGSVVLANLQADVYNMQQDMKHLVLELQFHQQKLRHFASENYALRQENQGLKNRCQDMSAAMEAQEQYMRHRHIEASGQFNANAANIGILASGSPLNFQPRVAPMNMLPSSSKSAFRPGTGKEMRIRELYK